MRIVYIEWLHTEFPETLEDKEDEEEETENV